MNQSTSSVTVTKVDREWAREWGVQAGAVASARVAVQDRPREGGTVKDLVREFLGLDGGRGEAEREAEEQEQEVAPVRVTVSLRVLRRCPNPTWIDCASPPPGSRVVSVRVRMNSRLAPGMLLPCELVGGTWKCVHAQLKPLG